MKRLLLMIIFLIFGVVPVASSATDVGGVIRENTTWTIENSPYDMVAPVEIAPGKTLLIEPGVVINNGRFEVLGALEAIGNAEKEIVFNNVNFVYWPPSGGNTPRMRIHLQKSQVNGGIMEAVPHGEGELIIEDCYLTDSEVRFYSKSVIAKNSRFVNSRYSSFLSFISGTGNIEGNTFYRYRLRSSSTFKNNLFYDTQLVCDALANVHNNTFICSFCESAFDTNENTALVAVGQGLYVDAKRNFWSTSSSEVIDSMIRDKKDTLGTTFTVQYLPFLTAPDPLTPVLPCTQFDLNTLTLHVPFVKIQSNGYEALYSLQLLLTANGFAIQNVGDFTDVSEIASFDLETLILHIPCVQVGDQQLWVDLKLEGNYLTIAGYGVK